MASFILHSDRDPQGDMFFFNPNVVSSEPIAKEYAEAFTHDSRPDDTLIPIVGEAALTLAADPDN